MSDSHLTTGQGSAPIAKALSPLVAEMVAGMQAYCDGEPRPVSVVKIERRGEGMSEESTPAFPEPPGDIYAIHTGDRWCNFLGGLRAFGSQYVAEEVAKDAEGRFVGLIGVDPDWKRRAIEAETEVNAILEAIGSAWDLQSGVFAFRGWSPEEYREIGRRVVDGLKKAEAKAERLEAERDALINAAISPATKYRLPDGEITVVDWAIGTDGEAEWSRDEAVAAVRKAAGLDNNDMASPENTP